MQSAFHQKVKVLPGNKIEIEHSELPVDETVDVFVLLPSSSKKEIISVFDIFNELPGRRHFKTAEEVDQYLKEERESWDS